MTNLTLLLVLSIPLSPAVPLPKNVAPTPPPVLAPQKPPTPEALAQIAQRRKFMDQLGFPFDPAKESEKTSLALAQLSAALQSSDEHVFMAGAADVSNSLYHTFPEEDLLKVLLPHVCKPWQEGFNQRTLAQSYLLEHVSRRYPVKARAILPELLKIVRNDRLSTYQRAMAIEAAARIGPNDAEVVRAFIDALQSPHPTSTSGVHDRIVEHLGNMGKAAWPAKKAIAAVFERGPWYQDSAFFALGKLALDEKPRPLADYLKRLQHIDKIPLEQTAAAFLHVQQLCNPGTPFVQPNTRPELMKSKPNKGLAQQARPVLYEIVAKYKKEHVYPRAALRTLFAIGSGSSPQEATILVEVVSRKVDADHAHLQQEAAYALNAFETTNRQAVLPFADGLTKLMQYDYSNSRAEMFAVIRRFGKDAAPALPALLDAFKKLQTLPYAADDLLNCADTIAVLGRDAPAGRSALIQLLGSDLACLQIMKQPERRLEVQASLLISVSGMGLPENAKERGVLLDRVRGWLKEDHDLQFMVAALLVERLAGDVTAKEGAEFTEGLVRVLKTGHRFIDDKQAVQVRLRNFPLAPHPLLNAQGQAARALGALGTKARAALPALQEFAKRELVDVRNTYLSEPPMNFTIREARKAVALIK